MAVCRPQHPLTRAAAPTIAQVLSYPLVGPTLTPGLSQQLLELVPADRHASLKRRGVLAVECDLSSLLKDVLRHSDCVSFMPTFMVSAELSAGQLACLPGVELGLRVRFGCAWLKSRTLSPITTRFIELLATHDAGVAARPMGL